jgi:hypothetical protein
MKAADVLGMLKSQFGVTGMSYRNGFAGESIEDLERSIRDFCAKRMQS